MPIKVGKFSSSVSAQSVSNVVATEASDQVNSEQDNFLTTVSVVSATQSGSASAKSTPTTGAASSKEKVVQSQVNRVTQATSSSQTAKSVKKDLQSGNSPASARVREAAQGAVKAAKNAVTSPSGDLQSVLSQRGRTLAANAASGLVTAGAKSLTGAVANSIAASARADSRTRQRGSTLSRSGTHLSSWPTPSAAPSPTPVVNLNTEDHVYKYGLYLLRPEIITLFDSDPLFDGDTPTDTNRFLSMQFSYAKGHQEAAYRRTRSRLSKLSYLPSLGYSESDLLPLDPATALESAGTSLFEQAVSKWDSQYTSVLGFESLAAERAIPAQDVASTLDIVNMPGNATSDEYSFSSLKSLIDLAIQDINASPTAAQYTVDSDFGFITVNSTFDLHDYLRDTSDGASFIGKLVNTDAEINVGFRSYTLMHTLMQQSFVSFAFGSARDSTVSDMLTRSRDESDPQSAYKYTVATGPLGRIATKSSFVDPTAFGDDSAEMAASVSSPDVAKVCLLRIVSLAAYKGSSIYDSSKTALDIFRESVGLPVGLSDADTGTGKPISDFELADSQSSAGLLFQTTSVDSAQKLIFFDRSHNPGLPSGYSHGYTRIFGDTANPAQTASDLSQRMTLAIDAHTSINQKLLSSDITLSRSSYKPADLGRLLMTNFAGLLESKWDSESFSTFYDNEVKTQLKSTYLSYLTVAGSNQTSFTRTVSLSATSSSLTFNPFTSEGSDKQPVYADHEIIRFLSLSIPYTGTTAEWSQNVVNLMMSYWSQRFDYETGVSSSPPSSIRNQIFFAEDPIQTNEIKSQLSNYYGQTTYLTKIEDYAEPVMDRLVTWSISTANAIFGAAVQTGTRSRGSDAVLPDYASLITHADGSTSYSFKEVCLLLVLFAANHMQSIFERVQQGERDPYNPYTKFKDSAETIVDELVSHPPVSYDDARLCLGIVSSQLSKAVTGLSKIVSRELLTDGKFNLIYTPCQAAAMTIRRYEFLYRKQRSPFHCSRYDETSVSRALERSAIRSLYKTDLMQLPDTRVLVVGLPAGIQHVIGLGQRYAKITITRRDQASVDTTYNTLSFIFDMFTFISPDASRAIGNTPWTATRDGSISDVTNINFFRIGKPSDAGLGNLTSHVCSGVTLSYVDVTVELADTSLLETSESGTTSEAFRSPSDSVESRALEIASSDVSVSDFIVDVEFIDDAAAAADLATTVDDVLSDPEIIGNHFVDYLLKTHMRNVAGVDMSESTFTTSGAAYSVDAVQQLDEAQSYVLNICAVDFLNPESVGGADLEASIKHLDLLSKTPIIRSKEYADLCASPTYFDRVFAIPINANQFTVAGEDTSPEVLELLS